MLYDPATRAVSRGDESLIVEWEASPSKLIWIDLAEVDATVEQEIFDKFEIHPLAVQDAQRTRHPPKIELFDNCLFILLRGLDANTTGIEFGVIQLSFFVGERFLITRHSKPSVSANWLWDELQTNPELSLHGPGGWAIALAKRLSSRYVEILLELEPRLDSIEDEMFERPNDALLAELTSYKSRLRHLARIARYHEHLATQLKMPTPFVAEDLEHEITDLYERVERTQSLASLYYEVASDLTDGYLALTSHRLNRVMQILTVITVIFVPLTFLAGIYGMNFENMPELGSRSGYFIVLGVMFVAAVIQLAIFRRKGWV